MDENTCEHMIRLKKLNAPRVTPEHIDSCIKSADYYVFPNTTTTVCLLTLTNGYTVLGESACASPENFDLEIGRSIAYTNAREKIWALEGYKLRQLLFESAEPKFRVYVIRNSSLVAYIDNLNEEEAQSYFVDMCNRHYIGRNCFHDFREAYNYVTTDEFLQHDSPHTFVAYEPMEASDT